MRIERNLKLAEAISEYSSYDFKLGAVITAGNRILSTGYNQIRHLKVGKKFTAFQCSLHAERDACSKIDKKMLKGSTITIFRKTKDGKPAEAFPCDQCLYLIKEMKIKQIISSSAEYPYYKVTKI